MRRPDWYGWRSHDYPASGVTVVHVWLWRWRWKRMRRMPCVRCQVRH